LRTQLHSQYSFVSIGFPDRVVRLTLETASYPEHRVTTLRAGFVGHHHLVPVLADLGQIGFGPVFDGTVHNVLLRVLPLRN